MVNAALEIEMVTLKIRAADPALGAQNMLSKAEHERLAGMHEGARPAFVTARGMLRQALGDNMGLLASSVPLVQEGTGRIFLDGFADDEPPFYSVSHTGGAEDGIAAVAVSETSPIGIDIQQLDPVADWMRIAERRFPEEEWLLLAAMPEAEARMLFFTLWAIKESFVKMEDGKLMPYLRGVELDLSSGKPVLKAPTPGGTEDATIYFHFIPEHQLVVSLVATKPVKVVLDSDIRPPSRRADPLNNRGAD
ncbi:4'-phosphopantetheinyl transferase family protein [Kordiimonas laminariae]|uniref:4'-phosphopantetheinyl transferase family protein n=1 Tax=Kordiimonas laminariae TaxID=2917717 RepID=UPI001FF3996E|nr:4'-phosphopantetheinyl transferase superfamily protein [Kordiimonas laminariae]MCK0068019.1 4'-phosphopantetheinyl transferase superfamily protein [Kordiimonas laminariae]